MPLSNPGAFKPIKTWNEFSSHTDNTGFLISKRGAKIKFVDLALKAYWKTPGAGAAPSPFAAPRHLELLSNLLQACLTWLKIKKDKLVTNKKGTDVNSRRRYISELADGVLQNMSYIIYTHDLYSPNQYGQYVFHKSKLGTLGSLGNGGNMQRIGGGVIKVDNHYSAERDVYKYNKKNGFGKTSVSANAIGDRMNGYQHGDEIRIPGSLNGQELRKATNLGNSIARKVFQGGIENLTIDEMKLIDQMASIKEGRGGFDVISKDSRYAFMAIPGDNGLLYNANDQLITTQNYNRTSNDQHMYAMDKYGNLLTKILGGLLQGNDLPQGQKAYNRFNHSSFNAAGKVICAGMITIRDGYLIEIDNNSGHYKPSRNQLHKCVSVLHADGANLSRCTVNVFEFKREMCPYEEDRVLKYKMGTAKYVHALKAVDFVGDRNLQDPKPTRSVEPE